jgi:hypothetical protein
MGLGCCRICILGKVGEHASSNFPTLLQVMEAIDFEPAIIVPGCNAVAKSFLEAGGAGNGCGAASVPYASIVVGRYRFEQVCGDAGTNCCGRLSEPRIAFNCNAMAYVMQGVEL